MTTGRVKALVTRVDELTALYQLTDRLYRAQSLGDVYEAALKALLGTLACSRASILLFDDAGVMRFVAWRGLSENYRNAVEGHSPWALGTRDPEPILVPDMERTNEPEWLKAVIKREGIRSLSFVPLVSRGAVIGKFMTYYDIPHAFDEREVELAVTIARQVGFSLERARAEQARQLAEEELRRSEERFRLMCEHAPVMIWMSGPQGDCLHLNRMLRAFWGVTDEDGQGFDWSLTIHPDDAPVIRDQVMKAVASHAGFSIKGRYLSADGRYRTLQTEARPRMSAQGEFLGMIGVNVDVTEREEAEQALRQSEERFRLAVEAAPSGMVMSDEAGRITLVNAQAESLFGYARDELVGQSIETLVPSSYRRQHPEYRQIYHASPKARPMGAGRELFAVRKDGSEIPVEIGLSPIQTTEGAMSLAAVVDITARKQAEAQRELLSAELDHRVKNLMAVVQAITQQTLDNHSPESIVLSGRIAALARTHNMLAANHWSGAALHEVAEAMLSAYATTGEPHFTVSGPELRLPARSAQTLGLVLHELATNAAKHGALSAPAGHVDVRWRVLSAGDRRLEVVWSERGGPAVSAPTRKGLGLKLIGSCIEHELGGTAAFDFAPQGVSVTLEVPLHETIPAGTGNSPSETPQIQSI